MVSYGSGQHGDATISTNTTESQPILEYENLTVESGVTFTLPSRCRLMIKDTLTVDGNIEVQHDIAGGGGVNKGGRSGGKLELLAKNIVGNGVIRSNGEAGETADTWGSQNNTNGGVGYSIPATGASGTAPGGGERGESARRKHNGDWKGNNNGSGGGGGASSVYDDATLKSYVEDYLLSGAYITQAPLDTMLPGSGGGGGGGGDTYIQAQANNHPNNTKWGMIDTGGGGGGAGGSFVSSGGEGGNGGKDRIYGDNVLTNDADSNDGSRAQAYFREGDGGAGGGAGGFILLVSENVELSVTFEAKGGDGGDGYWSQRDGYNYEGGSTNNNTFTNEHAAHGGGGGGGGAGGFIVGFTDKTPTINLTGGDKGISGAERFDGNTSTNANSGGVGQDGTTFIYNIEELL